MQLAFSWLSAGIYSVSCRQSLFCCAVVEVTHPPWKILMFLSGGWYCDSTYLYCVVGVFIADVITCLHHGSCRRSWSFFRCTFVDEARPWHCLMISVSDGIVYCGSQLFNADAIARLLGCRRWSLLSSSLVEWSETARLHGSCRQSLFSSSLVEAGTACLVHGSCRQFCFGPVVLW